MGKQKKNIRRSRKIKPNKRIISFRKIHIVYNERQDRFVTNMIVKINDTRLSIVGDLIPEYYLDGLLIKQPNGMLVKDTNCDELFLSKKDVPKLYASVIKYINSTGDHLDDDTYDKILNGSLDLIDTNKYINDQFIDKVIEFLTFYKGEHNV